MEKIGGYSNSSNTFRKIERVAEENQTTFYINHAKHVDVLVNGNEIPSKNYTLTKDSVTFKNGLPVNTVVTFKLYGEFKHINYYDKTETDDLLNKIEQEVSLLPSEEFVKNTMMPKTVISNGVISGEISLANEARETVRSFKDYYGTGENGNVEMYSNTDDVPSDIGDTPYILKSGDNSVVKVGEKEYNLDNNPAEEKAGFICTTSERIETVDITREVNLFKNGNDVFLFVGKYNDGSSYSINSTIFKLNHKTERFEKVQDIPTKGCTSSAFVEFNNDIYLFVGAYYDGSNRVLKSNVFKLNKTSKKFVKVQDITTTTCNASSFIQSSVDLYLFVGNHTNGSTYNINSHVYKLNKNTGLFIKVQDIATNGVYTSSSLRINNDSYLFIGNYYNNSSRILNSFFYKLNTSTGLFEKVQDVGTKGCHASSAIEFKNEGYFFIGNQYDGTSYELESNLYKLNTSNDQLEKVGSRNFNKISDAKLIVSDDKLFLLTGDGNTTNGKEKDREILRFKEDNTFEVSGKFKAFLGERITGNGSINMIVITDDTNNENTLMKKVRVLNFKEATTMKSPLRFIETNVKAKELPLIDRKTKTINVNDSKDITGMQTTGASFAELNGEYYLAIANNRNSSGYGVVSKVYKLNKTNNTFETFKEFNTESAYDFALHVENNELYVTYAQNADGTGSNYSNTSEVFKLVNADFVSVKTINTVKGISTKFINVDGITKLAILENTQLKIYSYDFSTDDTVLEQTFNTLNSSGFDVGNVNGKTFLYIGTYNSSISTTDKTGRIYKLNNDSGMFEYLETLSAVGSWGVSFKTFEDQLFLVVSTSRNMGNNYADNANYIYKYSKDLNRFLEVKRIKAFSSKTSNFFVSNGKLFLLVDVFYNGSTNLLNTKLFEYDEIVDDFYEIETTVAKGAYGSIGFTINNLPYIFYGNSYNASVYGNTSTIKQISVEEGNTTERIVVDKDSLDLELNEVISFDTTVLTIKDDVDVINLNSLTGLNRKYFNNKTDAVVETNAVKAVTAKGLLLDVNIINKETLWYYIIQERFTHLTYKQLRNGGRYFEAFNPYAKTFNIVLPRLKKCEIDLEVKEKMKYIRIDFPFSAGVDSMIFYGDEDNRLRISSSTPQSPASNDPDFISIKEGKIIINTDMSQFGQCIISGMADSETQKVILYESVSDSTDIEITDAEGKERYMNYAQHKVIDDSGNHALLTANPSRGIEPALTFISIANNDQIYSDDLYGAEKRKGRLRLKGTYGTINLKGNNYSNIMFFADVDGSGETKINMPSDDVNLNIKNVNLISTQGIDKINNTEVTFIESETITVNEKANGFYWVGRKGDGTYVHFKHKPQVGLYEKEFAEDNRPVFDLKDKVWRTTVGGELVENNDFSLGLEKWEYENGNTTFKILDNGVFAENKIGSSTGLLKQKVLLDKSEVYKFTSEEILSSSIRAGVTITKSQGVSVGVDSDGNRNEWHRELIIENEEEVRLHLFKQNIGTANFKKVSIFNTRPKLGEVLDKIVWLPYKCFIVEGKVKSIDKTDSLNLLNVTEKLVTKSIEFTDWTGEPTNAHVGLLPPEAFNDKAVRLPNGNIKGKNSLGSYEIRPDGKVEFKTVGLNNVDSTNTHLGSLYRSGANILHTPLILESLEYVDLADVNHSRVLNSFPSIAYGRLNTRLTFHLLSGEAIFTTSVTYSLHCGGRVNAKRIKG